ncbi:MAG: response regulator [Planctomycetota bacterium]|jgi:putative nucleotidyltransferase with HDIG domain
MKGKIIIVDDEPSICDLLDKLLSKDGHTVFTAGSADEGIEVLKSNPDLNLIISDQRMPVVSGADFLQRCLKEYPSAERIALTGYSDTDVIMECVNKARVFRFLMKPWNDDDLQAIVNEAVDNSIMKIENDKLNDKIYEQNLELQKHNAELEQRVKERTRHIEGAKDNLEKSFHDLQHVVMRLMELYEYGLRGHGRRVSMMSRSLAENAGCSEQDIFTVASAAMLHDIGKIGLPPSVLRKKNEYFTKAEREIFKQHSSIGAEILREVSGFDVVAEIVLHHHEAFGGTGYPDNLRANDILLGARIIAICDSYDRYRYPPGGSVLGPKVKAQQYIASLAGTKFDPELAELFLKNKIYDIAESGNEEIEMSITHVLPGMKLSKSIVNSIGKVLLTKGTVFTNEVIDQLAENPGFDQVVSRVIVYQSSIPKDSENDSDEFEISSAEASPASKSGSSKEKPLIIAVDDERSILNALKRELHRAGYEVDTFTDSLRAFQQLRQEENVYALITDYNMPGIRGDRFLKQVQKEFPDLPCLVITGFASKEVITELAKTAHVARILSKPWDKQVLLETLAGFEKEEK